MSMALGIDIFLYDNKAPEDRRFLYLHRSRTRKAADTKSDHLEPDVKSGIVWRGVLNVAGRQWSVHAFPAPAFFEMHRRRTSWMVLAGGLLFTALLGAYLFSSINRTAKIEALATDLSLANKKLQQEIVEHEKAELARQESELRFRSLVETTSDWVWEVDRNAVYRYASPKIFDLLGYEPEEVLGRTPFDLMPPEEARRVRGIYGTIVAAQRPFRFLENTNFHKDGHTVVLESSGVPVYDNNGAFRGYRGIDRDITERKRLEEEILRAQKLESLGVLAGGLAHDFNNLLTSELGNISLAKFHTEPDGEADGLLTEAEKASLRARDLTQQLLTFSKGGAPVLKTSTIGNLIKDSSNFALRGSNVRCDLHLPADLQTVEVDEGQMSRVIHNLVINADQAMPQGGEIRIKCENIEIGGEDPVPLKHGPYVKISIKDQGAGIPDEHLHRIFDPYFTTKQKGSGLGLAGAYSIIKRHHGHMTVESELGVGTLFTLYLPAAKKDLFQEHDIMEGIYRGEGKILLMDDEEFIRKVAGTMLVQLGYEVEYATDGAQAIELYSSARDLGIPFRAVIMDLTVPGGMGGEEAMKKLLEIDSDVRAIVSSGYADDPVMANFSEFGFKGVVTKPYRIKDLSEVVQKVLDSGSIA
jgi:PAS domain S-box-containing protein